MSKITYVNTPQGLKTFYGKWEEIPEELKGYPAVEVDWDRWTKWTKFFNSNWDTQYYTGEKYYIINTKTKETRERFLSLDLVKELLRFSNWAEYDLEQVKNELDKAKEVTKYYEKLWVESNRDATRLKEEIDRLENALKDIYHINEVGGAGSRRKVREIILSLLPDVEEVEE